MYTFIEGLLNIAPLINTGLMLLILLGVPIYLKRHASLEETLKEQNDRLLVLEQQDKEKRETERKPRENTS